MGSRPRPSAGAVTVSPSLDCTERAFYWRQRSAPTATVGGARSGQRSQALCAGTKPAINIMCFKLKPFVLCIGVITVKQPHAVISLEVGRSVPGGRRLSPCAGPASLGAHQWPLAPLAFWPPLPLLAGAHLPFCREQRLSCAGRAGAQGWEYVTVENSVAQDITP